MTPALTIGEMTARLGHSRRGFLGVSGAGLLLAGCGGGKGAGDNSAAGVGGFTGTYEGPEIDRVLERLHRW